MMRVPTHNNTFFCFCSGERPPLPDSLTMDPQYGEIIELFKMCTMQDYKKRPSAAQILQFMGVL